MKPVLTAAELQQIRASVPGDLMLAYIDQLREALTKLVRITSNSFPPQSFLAEWRETLRNARAVLGE